MMAFLPTNRKKVRKQHLALILLDLICSFTTWNCPSDPELTRTCIDSCTRLHIFPVSTRL